jgi:hypothetical protein
MFVLMLEHNVPILKTYLSCKVWCKKSQMLMCAEGTMHKSKSLHFHRNNKNHISENQNGEHSHCFLIHLNFKNMK